ncbi:hypothetical protein CTA1_10606 [Colletotrichum tanaceti]|uniref:Cyanovirin-N domain-containing protein n=1 Tax=Colletotrichum tanaceti TaxID=1306861 RepID=A0A4V6DGJ5_9PEZI|nr:hypothetical protein CTA1_10606 [Colletotrichum tanaceti]
MLPATVIGALLTVVPTLALASPASSARSAAVEEASGGKIAARSFAASCRSCKIDYISILSCECRNTIGQWVLAGLDISSCFTNDQCWLRWRQGGGAFQSCRNARVVDGFTLTAECRAGDGVWCGNRINLDENIHNSNGNMVCG